MKKISKERWSYIFKRNFVLFFTGLIPTTISLICTQQGAKEYVKEICPSDEIPFIYSRGWQLLIIVVVCIFVPIIVNIICDLIELNSNVKLINMYNSILSYIQDCVDRKKSRFFNEIGKHTSPATVFTHITQPEKQLEALCSGLCNVFKDFFEINDIKGTIIDCDKNKMSAFLVVCGDDQPSISIEDLNTNDSLARYCIKCKTTCVVENAEKCSFFYSNEGCNVKSALCFPLKRGTEIAMLVCLTSKQKKIFKKSLLFQYSTIFDYFGSRMLLEDYLYDLKKGTNGK